MPFPVPREQALILRRKVGAVGGFMASSSIGTFMFSTDDYEDDEQPTLDEWLEGYEAAVEAGQSRISREEAERRYYQTYGSKE